MEFHRMFAVLFSSVASCIWSDSVFNENKDFLYTRMYMWETISTRLAVLYGFL